jgi:uroporphyrinogen-III synthase
MNLHGLRILNTRPLAQGASLSADIHAAGGIAIHFPALSIEPTTNDWVKKVPELSLVDYAIFISSNAVHYFFKKINAARWPTSIHNIAIGKGTASALMKWQINVAQLPVVADSEHLLKLPSLQTINDKTILLIKGEQGKQDIANGLTERKANLIELAVYKRGMPQVTTAEVESLWQDDAVDIILFTSQEALENIVTLVGKHSTWLCKKPCVVISERIAKKALAMGMQKVIISPYDNLLETFAHYAMRIRHDNQQ